MGIHYYDSCPRSLETQCIRLKSARTLTEAHIPCVVWAEDALCFAHFVPTELFAQHLIVPDDLVEAASSTIQSQFPYSVGPATKWTEFKLLDPQQSSPFPHSVHLHPTVPAELHEDDPPMIIIHPQSDLSLDVRDHTLSTSLVPPLPADYASIRFPTRPAFLNSLIAMILDPPSGRKQVNFIGMMRVFISYIIMYTHTLREVQHYVLPSGEFDSRCAAVIAGLREENRSYLEVYLRRSGGDWATEVAKRKAVLERLGRHVEARKPWPLNYTLPRRRSFHSSSLGQSNPENVMDVERFHFVGLSRVPSSMRRAKILQSMRSLIRKM